MSQVLPFRLDGPVRRILVMRPRALGDLMLATPALRALKQGFPDAELHMVVDDTLAPVLSRNPFVDRLWLFPRSKPRSRTAWPRLYWNLRRQRFDWVLDLHGSPRTALLARFTGARHRVGYALRVRGRLYTIRVPRDSDRRGRPARQYAAKVNLDVVARCGVQGPALDDTTLVYVADALLDRDMAQELDAVCSQRPRVGLAPAGTWQAKTYTPEAYACVGDRLVEAGCQVLLLWGPGERKVAERVQQCMRAPARLAPETNLDTLAALLGQLDLLLGNDSGVKHLAVARGTPTLTLFGPTSPVTWMPPTGEHAWMRLRLPCVECDLTGCLHHLCMHLLPPEAVAERALEILRRRESSRPFSSGMELPRPSG